MKVQKIITKLFFYSLFLFVFLSLPDSLFAQQSLSLSISPPLFEAIIKPGKEVRQIYTVSNGGGDIILKPKIVYFTTTDENGTVNLSDINAPDWIKYDKTPFILKSQEQTNFTVLISPPIDAIETDHFVTLVFEGEIPVNISSQNSSLYKTQIGSNILITISKDGSPKKIAEIIEFSAPKIVDSIFGKIIYQIKLKNDGGSFWKPNGKIIISNGKNINISPLNVLSGTTRRINCLEDINLVECKIDSKFLIGKYEANLEFNIDDDSKIYKETSTTIALPFSLVGVIFTLLTFIKIKVIFKI